MFRSRPTGWFAPPGNRTKPISVHGFASRNASAERLAFIGRQIVAGRLVIYRNGDEAGIGDYVEQNFHPERHLLSLLRQSGSRTPAKRKPRWHPQMPAGCSCLHLSQLRPATSGRRFRSRSFLIFPDGLRARFHWFQELGASLRAFLRLEFRFTSKVTAGDIRSTHCPRSSRNIPHARVRIFAGSP